MSDCFIAHLLTRNIRIEEDLIDQLFNSSEKRLARTLLLLARYGKPAKPTRVGLIEDDGERPIRINNSLLSAVLHD
jgi:hypothetical protein